MELSNIGNKIKEARLNKGLSQESLAELSNVSHRTIQRIESGKVNPRLSTQLLLSEALDLDLSILNQEQGEIKKSEINVAKLKMMNLSLIISMLFPLITIPLALVFSQFIIKSEPSRQIAKTIMSFQVLWVLGTILLFFLGIFSSNLITGDAGNAQYVAFIIYICCILFNIYFISKNTLQLNKGMTKSLEIVPNFF